MIVIGKDNNKTDFKSNMIKGKVIVQNGYLFGFQGGKLYMNACKEDCGK